MLTRAAIVRIAHEKPELRSRLVPILRKMAHGPIAFKDPDVMLYVIDPEGNHSKFYEMKVVPYGQATPAKSTKMFTRMGDPTGGFVLMKRWGRLTDSPGTGRVDSLNEVFDNASLAEAMMYKTRAEKVHKGYVDVSRTQKYPIGLGGAGFGWGGQAACSFTPEMKKLLEQVKDMDLTLQEFSKILERLSRTKSSIAPDLFRLYRPLEQAIDAMGEFLGDELSACQ